MRRFAIAAVRAWTRLYTWGMDPAAAELRIAEIESDLWESEQAGDGGATIVLRLLLGVYDDLVWRTTFDLVHERGPRRTATLGVIVTVAAIIAAWWVIDTGRMGQLPAPPRIQVGAPAPPRTPPPPPPPPQEVRRSFEQGKKE